MSLGRRGYAVTIADAADQPGGRVHYESQLPGLSAWKRTIDYRLGQIDKLKNVDLFLHSELDRDQVLEFARELGTGHVVCATGSVWDRDGLGRAHRQPIPRDGSIQVFTPDDVMAGALAGKQVVVYDDDHYYMGGVIAEALVKQGADVMLVTPGADVSGWTRNTLEQETIEKHLFGLGVAITEKHLLHKLENGEVIIEPRDQRRDPYAARGPADHGHSPAAPGRPVPLPG